MHVYNDVIIVSCLFCLPGFKAVVDLTTVDTVTSVIVTLDHSKADWLSGDKSVSLALLINNILEQ